eukprot:6480446-Amphidinium_carterae.1
MAYNKKKLTWLFSVLAALYTGASTKKATIASGESDQNCRVWGESFCQSKVLGNAYTWLEEQNFRQYCNSVKSESPNDVTLKAVTCHYAPNSHEKMNFHNVSCNILVYTCANVM